MSGTEVGKGPSHSAWSIAKVAYLAPFASPLAIVQAFWPVILFYAAAAVFGLQSVVLGGTVASETSDTETPIALGLPTSVLILFVAGSIYAWLLAARGAVAWHRHMILGESITWTPPIPSGHSLRYAIWGVVIWLLVGLASSFVIAPLIFLFASATEGPASLSTNGAVQVGAYPVLLNAVLSAALYALIILVFARLAMWLPQVAVDAADNDWYDHVPVRRILLLTAVPLSFVSSLLPAIPFGSVTTALQFVVGGYALLVALSGLSIAFRLRRTPRAEF